MSGKGAIQMRYDQTCEDFAGLALRQSKLAINAPVSFFAGAMLAGAFVGIAMILALSAGAHVDPSIRPLVMGSVFGVSVILVVFGGGELFTGQTMFATFALLRGRLTPMRVLHLLVLTWAGNLWGAVAVCTVFAVGGGGHVFGPTPLLHDLVAFKSQSSVMSLLARAILCNWLACLGIWTASRLTSDGAKMVILAWCVMAYVTCGLEHSVANMALFSLGIMAPMPLGEFWSVAGSVVIVSLGNLGGGLLVAGAYTLYSSGERCDRAAARATSTIEELQLPHVDPKVRANLMNLVRERMARAA